MLSLNYSKSYAVIKRIFFIVIECQTSSVQDEKDPSNCKRFQRAYGLPAKATVLPTLLLHS